MYQRNLVHNVLDLVSLQVSDHMPTDICGKLGYLVHQLLHLIFSEIPDAFRIGFLQHGDRHGFAHRNQRHLVTISGRPSAGTADLSLHCLQILSYHLKSPPWDGHFWFMNWSSLTESASNTI